MIDTNRFVRKSREHNQDTYLSDKICEKEKEANKEAARNSSERECCQLMEEPGYLQEKLSRESVLNLWPMPRSFK